jgi:hypothetical protein
VRTTNAKSYQTLMFFKEAAAVLRSSLKQNDESRPMTTGTAADGSPLVSGLLPRYARHEGRLNRHRHSHSHWPAWMRWSVFVLMVGFAMVVVALRLSAYRSAARLVPSATGLAPVHIKITWVMVERFGARNDLNRDGRPDLPNSYEYVNPGCYEVQLATNLDMSGDSNVGLNCDWTIDSMDGSTRLRASGPRPIIRLPMGPYSVTATVRLADGRITSAREMIRVKDLLIVALGDSLATGEGNPETPARWDDPGRPSGGKSAGLPSRPTSFLGRFDPPTPARWADGGSDGDRPRTTPAGKLPPASVLHTRAHRSTHSGPARFAMRLEAEDSHTSVTYVCLASTGARTDDLFVPDQSGQNKALGPGPVLPAQLDELRALLGSRPIDVLVLSIGINDCRSFDLLGELVKREIRCIDAVRLLDAYPTRREWLAAAPDLKSFVDPGDLGHLAGSDTEAQRKEFGQDAALIYDLADMARSGLRASRDQLMRLIREITHDPLLARADVYVLEYPDPTKEQGGATSNAILDELVPGLRVNRRELALLRERLLRPLNRTLLELAEPQGWSYVSGIFDAFRVHGYAASETWFIRAKESERLQGPRLGLAGYLRGEFAPGMLHPNSHGHEVIADCLYRSFVSRPRQTQDGKLE